MSRIIATIILATFLVDATGLPSYGSPKTHTLRPAAAVSANKALLLSHEKPSSAGEKIADDGLSQFDDIAKIGQAKIRKRLIYLRDVLGIYPGDDPSLLFELIRSESSALKERADIFNAVTETHNLRFDFNLCPLLLTVKDRVFSRIIREMKDARSKRRLSDAIKEAAKRSLKTELKGKILQEYYPQFQDPVFGFVDLENEFEFAEEEHKRFDKMEEEEQAESEVFRKKDNSLRGEFKSFFMAKPKSEGLKDRLEFYEENKRPGGRIRVGVIKTTGDVYVFIFPNNDRKRFYLGGGWWDPVGGKRVKRKSENAQHNFTQYKDRSKRYVWVEIVLLKGGRRGILIYLRKRGRPIGFGVWDEKQEKFKKVFDPTDIAISKKHTSTKPLLTRWLNSSIEIADRFQVLNKPFVMTKSELPDGKVAKKRGIYIITDMQHMTRRPLKETEAITESVPEDKNHKRLRIYGRDKKGPMVYYEDIYYKGKTADQGVWNLNKEAIGRFTDWNLKDPPPLPLIIDLIKENGEIPLHRIKGKKVAYIYGGLLRGLKIGDKLWVEMFRYKHNGKWHKGAKIFRLNEDLVPEREVFRVWYDEKEKGFRKITQKKGDTKARVLNLAERFELAWRVFWFGWSNKLAGFDRKGFLREVGEEYILQELRRKPLTIEDLSQRIGGEDAELSDVKALIKKLTQKQQAVYIGYGKYAYLEKEVTVSDSNHVFVNSRQISVASYLVPGDRVRIATEDGWPIMLYEVVGKKIRARNPVPLVTQRDESGKIRFCTIRDIDIKRMKGRTYLENVVLSDIIYKRILHRYRIYLDDCIERIDNKPISATLFFNGKELVEIHLWIGYSTGMYRINSLKARFIPELTGDAKPRMILKGLKGKKNIHPGDPEIEVWDNTTQLTEKELDVFVWKQLENGPKSFSELIKLLKGRRYSCIELEKILNKEKSKEDKSRVVRLFDGRYAVAIKRTKDSRNHIAFHENTYSVRKRWRKKKFVWAAYEKKRIFAVTGPECDFSEPKGVDFYKIFRDKENNILHTALVLAYKKMVSSEVLLIDYVIFPESGRAELLNGEISLVSLKGGKPVGRIASMILVKDSNGDYNIRRLDYRDSFVPLVYNDLSVEGEDVSVRIVGSTPTHSVVNIKGRCRRMTPNADSRSCESADIITKSQWQERKKQQQEDIESDVDEHLKKARSLEKDHKYKEALEEYNLAFMADPYAEDEKTKAKLISLSTMLCLDEAYMLLERGRYGKAEKLFEKAKPFITRDKKHFSQSYAKARALAAYTEGIRLFDGGNYERAIVKLTQALEYRESLGGNFITEQELERINKNLDRANAMCKYIKARKLYLKGEEYYPKALELLNEFYSTQNGRVSRLRLSLTLELIKGSIEKQETKSKEKILAQAIESALRILNDLDAGAIPKKDKVKQAMGRIKRALGAAKDDPNLVEKKNQANTVFTRLEEVLDSFQEPDTPDISTDEIVEQEEEDQAPTTGDDEYDGADGYDIESLLTAKARDQDGFGVGGTYNWESDRSKYSLAKYYLRLIKRKIPDFKPLEGEELIKEYKKHLGDDYVAFNVMTMLTNIENTNNNLLLLYYILRIADMFMGSTEEVVKKRVRLDKDVNQAIKRLSAKSSSAGVTITSGLIDAIQAIRELDTAA